MPRAVWIVCGGIAAAMCGLAAWRTWGPAAPSATYQAKASDLQGKAQSLFHQQPLKPLSGFTNANELKLALANVRPDTPSEAVLKPGDVEGVAGAVAELMLNRFGADSPEAYLEWRKRAGYALRDRVEILDRRGESASFRLVSGREPAESDSLESIYCTLWRHIEKESLGPSRWKAVASEASGRALAFGEIRAGSPRISFPRPSGLHGAEVWMTPPSGRYPSWFCPPKCVQDWLSAAKVVRAASYAMVVESDDGTRQSFVFRLAADPQTDRWYVIEVDMYGSLNPNAPGIF